MRSLLLIITVLFTLALAALGYVAHNHLIDFHLYVVISSAISVALLWLCIGIGRLRFLLLSLNIPLWIALTVIVLS